MRRDWAAASLLVMLAGCDAGVVPEPPAPASAPAPLRPEPSVSRASGLQTELLAAKESRIEICSFGTQGVAVLRDAYLASTRGGPPGPGRLPDWGTYPALGPTDEAAALPFLRFMEACHKARAAGVGAPIPAIDPALATYEGYMTELHKTVVNASRYYARKDYERDGFRAGLAFHEVLSRALPKLDDERAAFVRAVAAWQKTRVAEPAPNLDEAGSIVLRAIPVTRGLTLRLLDAGPAGLENAKLLEEVGALADELERAKREHPEAPHAEIAVTLRAYLTAAEALVEQGDRPSALALYPVAAAQALLCEMHHAATVALARRSR